MERLKFSRVNYLTIGDSIMGEEEKRKYSLAILIILVILCWPLALVYYFTRPKVKAKEMRTCIGCGRHIPVDYAVCPHCGKKIEKA